MHPIGSTVTLLARGATGGHGTPRPRVVSFIGAAIFVLFGLLNVVKPDVSWRLSKWQYHNPALCSQARAASSWPESQGLSQ
jgi:hypothetical protein